MNKLLRALAIMLNLLIPYLVIIFLVFVCFFIYGSGAIGAEELERQMYIWTGIYILIGLVHLFLVYRYFKFLTKKHKIVFMIFIALIYICISCSYMVL